MPSMMLFPLLRRNQNRSTNRGRPSSSTDDDDQSHSSNNDTDHQVEERSTMEYHVHQSQTRSQERLHTIQNFRLRAISEKNDECSVCAKDFEINDIVSLLPCGHYFCEDCATNWFDRVQSTTCPLCRYDLAQPEDIGDEQEEHCCNSASGSYNQPSDATSSLDGSLRDEVIVSTRSSPTALSSNFDLIMAKTLQATRARREREEKMSSSF
jgi:hypothetical protein